MTEILVLNIALFIAFVLAPLMTKSFFLAGSKIYSDGHKASLMVLLGGALLNVNYTSIVWPLFCSYGFFLYLKSEYKLIFSVKGAAGCIPFIFSLISSVWFVAGVNNLQLLGYNKVWSYYAALHGCFLGWILTGCLAFLARRKNSSNIYLWGCYMSFLLFLFVAFGIDGVPYIKRIGVVGFSLMMPFVMGYYAINLKKANKLSMSLSWISIFSIILSMSLAVLNEFWAGFPKMISGVSTMVMTHGLINMFVAVPCFFLAIRLERDE